VRTEVIYRRVVTIVETVLIFVGIPALAYVVLTVLVFGPGYARAPRYRPGRPWDHPAVWYLPRPEQPGEPGGTGHAALEPGRAQPALPGSRAQPALPAGRAQPASPSGGPLLATAASSKAAKGGAHGRW
jgi:hypothetical protein